MSFLLWGILAVAGLVIGVVTYEVLRAFVEVYEKTGRKNMILHGLPSVLLTAAAALALVGWALYSLASRLGLL